MLKYVSHFFLQIFPSVIATVVGAYIVNYYIVPKNHDAPKSAVASTPDPVKDVGSAEVLSAEPSSEDGAKTKPADKAAAEKPAVEKPALESKRAKLSIKPAASEKSVATVSVAPAVVTPAEASPTNDDRRSANDLARAALDRLRVPGDPVRKEAIATPPAKDQPRVTVASTPPQQPPVQPQVQQQMQPLPPAVLITAPANGAIIPASPPESREPQNQKESQARLTPPGEIPGAPPLDLHAPRQHQTSIADDVMSKAKSVFEAVIPR